MAQPKNDRRMGKERLARRIDAVEVKVRDRPRCVGLKRINGSGRGGDENSRRDTSVFIGLPGHRRKWSGEAMAFVHSKRRKHEAEDDRPI